MNPSSSLAILSPSSACSFLYQNNRGVCWQEGLKLTSFWCCFRLNIYFTVPPAETCLYCKSKEHNLPYSAAKENKSSGKQHLTINQRIKAFVTFVGPCQGVKFLPFPRCILAYCCQVASFGHHVCARTQVEILLFVLNNFPKSWILQGSAALQIKSDLWSSNNGNWVSDMLL